MCLLAEFAPGGWAQQRPSEYQVKAAYLFNLGKFVRSAGGGPVAKGPTFDICILGRDSIGPSLDRIVAGDSIENRPVRVVRQAWRVARKRERIGCGGHFVDLAVQVRCRP